MSHSIEDFSQYTRVSEILSIFQAYAYVEKSKLKKAIDIGTTIHEAIAADLEGRFFPIMPSHRSLFDSYLMWKEANKSNLTNMIIEKRFYDDDWMVTGKPDLILIKDKEIRIVDFKTGSWAHPEIWRLQGEFYAHLYDLNCKIAGHKVSLEFVHLQKTASHPQVYIWESDEWKRHQLLPTCYRCWKYFNEARKDSRPIFDLGYDDAFPIKEEKTDEIPSTDSR